MGQGQDGDDEVHDQLSSDVAEAEATGHAFPEHEGLESSALEPFRPWYAARCLGIDIGQSTHARSTKYAREASVEQDWDTWSTTAVDGGEEYNATATQWRPSTKWVPRSTAPPISLVKKSEIAPVYLLCDVCNTNLNGREQLLEHLKGKMHRRNIRARREMQRNRGEPEEEWEPRHDDAQSETTEQACTQIPQSNTTEQSCARVLADAADTDEDGFVIIPESLAKVVDGFPEWLQ